MDDLACPDLSVLQVFQDIDFPRSYRSIFTPAVPMAVIGEPVLSGAGSKYPVSCFRPRELVFQLSHETCLSQKKVLSPTLTNAFSLSEWREGVKKSMAEQTLRQWKRVRNKVDNVFTLV